MSAMNWSLQAIADVLSVPIVGLSTNMPLIARVLTDSRQVQQGDLFVALPGERVDGHDFIDAVIEQGAVALLLTRAPQQPLSVPYLLVDDAVIALQHLAAAWRRQQALQHALIVTGSNGKTSVKEMLRAGLSAHYGQAQVLATEGNLNNHLGLPTTLLNLRAHQQAAVIEVGANHLGEIAQLAPLVQADVALVTSIARAHVGEFGSLAHIMQAKGEIWSSLPVSGGTAIVPIVRAGNEFDAWPVWQAALQSHHVIAFGQLADVQNRLGWQDWVGVVSRRLVDAGQMVQLRTSRWGEAELFLPIAGAHQANNLAGAVAALLSLGVAWEDIARGMAQLSLPGGRLRLLQPLPQLTLIDDSYNANATSMKVALSVLAEQSAAYRVFVMGEMGELGDDALALHQEVVQEAKRLGIDALCVSGRFKARLAAEMQESVAEDDPEILAQWIWQTYQRQGSLAVLVKGSRSSRMERVIDCLMTQWVMPAKEGQEV